MSRLVLGKPARVRRFALVRLPGVRFEAQSLAALWKKCSSESSLLSWVSTGRAQTTQSGYGSPCFAERHWSTNVAIWFRGEFIRGALCLRNSGRAIEIESRSVMTAKKSTMALGQHVYGVGMMTLGLACLAFGDFLPGQTVPDNFPARTVLAYIAGAFMVIAAAAVEWRRTAVWGAAALTGYYAVFVLVLMNGRLLLSNYAAYGTYEGISMQLAIAASGLIVYATAAQLDSKIDPALAARLSRLGQLAFGVCALIWGGAHFVYMNLTAPLVPKWLPPGQLFWGYITGGVASSPPAWRS